MSYSITEAQMFDYMKCPVYYRIKYGDNKISVTNKKTVNSLLGQVVSSFCLQLMDEKLMTPNELKRNWDILCKYNQDTVDTKANMKGASMLLTFYRWAEARELRVVDCFSEYAMTFGIGSKNNIHIRGDIGIIVCNKNGEFEKLIVDFSQAQPDQTKLDSDLKTSIDSVAFYSIYHKELVGTTLYHVKTNKEYYTIRDPRTEAKRVAHIAYNIAKAINTNVWYPAESALCSNTCNVKDFCRMWGISIM